MHNYLGGSKLKKELNKLRVKDLRKLVSEFNKIVSIRGYSLMKKSQIINALATKLNLEVDNDQILILNPLNLEQLSVLFNGLVYDSASNLRGRLSEEVLNLLKGLDNVDNVYYKRQEDKTKRINQLMKERKRILDSRKYNKRIEGYEDLLDYDPPYHIEKVTQKEYLGGKGFLKNTRQWIKNLFRRKGKKIPKHEEEHIQTHAKIAKEAYVPHNARNRNIDGYVYQKDKSHDKRAVYHHPEKNHSIVGQRGTVLSDADDLADDANILLGRSLRDNNDRFKQEDKFINEHKKDGKKVTITGHSLGGTYSKELGYKHGLESHNFNSGSSIHPNQVVKNAIHALNPNTHTYAVNSDIISTNDLFTKNRINRKKGLSSHSMDNFIKEKVKGSAKLLIKEFNRIKKALA